MPPRGSIAILLHGAGSCGSVARRLIPADSLVGAGFGDGIDVETIEDRRGQVPALIEALDDRVVRARAAGASVTVAGISLGAHAVARWAAFRGPSAADRLILALPAWTGAPDATASLTARTADDIRRRGSTAVLDDLRRATPTALAGLLDMLSMGWEAYPDDAALADALQAAAGQRGPLHAELAAISIPSVVVGLHSDAVHPLRVARAWNRVIPTSRLATTRVERLASDPAGLTAAVRRGIAALGTLG